MLTWSSDPDVNYYEPLLSSSEAISDSKRENSFKKLRLTRLPRGYLGDGPTSCIPPLPVIIVNNHLGIPPTLLNAVIIVVGVLSSATCC